MSENKTHISVEASVKEKFDQLREKYAASKTNSDFLKELMNAYEEYMKIKSSGQGPLIEMPSDKHDVILQAIEDVKPPSKWRDMFLFFLMASMGGLGIGILIP